MRKKKTTDNVITYIGFEAVNKSLPFVLNIILVNFLTVAEIGLVAQFNALVGLLSILIGLSVHGAISVSFFKMSRNELNEYLFNVLLILFVSTMLFLLIQSVVYEYLHSWINVSQQLFLLAGLCASFSFISTLNLVLWQSEMKPIKYGLFQLLLSLSLFTSALYFVIVMGFGWQGRIYSQIASVIIFGLISLGFLKYRDYITVKFNIEHIKHALKFGLPLVPHALLSWVFMGFNILLISEALGQEHAGKFSIAMQLVLILSVIYAAINRAIQPIAFKSLAAFKNEGESLDEYRRLSYKIILLNLSVGLVAIIVLPQVLLTVFPVAYHGVEHVLYILIGAEVIHSLYYIFVKAIFFNNKTHYLLMASTLTAVTHMTLSYLFIDSYSEFAVAFSQLISYVILLTIIYFFSQKEFYIKWV